MARLAAVRAGQVRILALIVLCVIAVMALLAASREDWQGFEI